MGLVSVDTSSLRAAVAELGLQAFQLAQADLFTDTEDKAAGHHVTGEMEASGHADLFTANDSEVSGAITYDAPQAAFTDEGTAPHVIEGNPLLAFNVGGLTIIVPRVDHPGYAGDQWFSDTVTDDNWQAKLSDAAASVSVVA